MIKYVAVDEDRRCIGVVSEIRDEKLIQLYEVKSFRVQEEWSSWLGNLNDAPAYLRKKLGGPFFPPRAGFRGTPCLTKTV